LGLPKGASFFLVSFAVCFFQFYALCQSPLGQVEAATFTKQQYGAGTQNWALTQDANGRVYVANNEGLLIYNGTNWQLHPVPNKTILRSIAFGRDGKLYAGAQDELGYYAPDKSGRLIYTSLKKLLPAADKTFADAWDIETAGNEIFFRANDKIIQVSGDRAAIHKPSANWVAIGRHSGHVLAQDEGKGLLFLHNNQWQTLVEQTALPPGFVFTDIIPHENNTSLVSTTSNGLFILAGNQLLPFQLKNTTRGQHFTSLAPLDEGSFLAGTYSNGVYRIGRNGDVLDNISSKNGLPNNTVRCLYTDAGGNAWTGLDNGIAYIACNGAIKHINPLAFNNGGGYSAKAFDGSLYFALSTGLQWLPLANATDISLVEGEPQTILNGLTWNVSVINNQLLTGRDDGFWKITNNKAAPVSSASGFWNYQPAAAGPPAQIAAGYYTGIRLFSESNGIFTDNGAVKNFNESSRYIETDGQNIWVSHPYRGVFKINIAGNLVSTYTQKNGLPADLDNHVFKIKNEIVFATPKGIYEYDAANDNIIASKKYADLFGQMPLRYLKEDEKGNIWFVQDKMLGVADFGGTKPAIHYIPELKNRILSGFENIFPYNTENVLVGAERGFYHINYEKYRKGIRPFKAYIDMLKIIGSTDSVLYGGYGADGGAPSEKTAIRFTLNSLHFSFSSSQYGQQPGTEFSSYLKGFDKGWSTWSQVHDKEYTNLPEGKYIFHVKARNSPSHESEECVYAFSILPPWYRSWWAYIIYAGSTSFFLYSLYKLQEKKHHKKQEERRQADQKKFEEEQRQLAYQHQLELEKNEKELIRLQNENLEAEIEHKNAELASNAMNLVQKKEFLLKITDELNKLNKSGKDTIETSELKKILRSLSSEEKLDEEWKQFSIHFNNVHSNFLITLKNKFPNLNTHELKLCAYLRMNLTSKEMAQLMSISVRGVEINRYRLRKKLQLQPKEDLFQFLLGVESSSNSKNDDKSNNSFKLPG
jgi:DNA-binding CsgD family transcriptional regulator